MSQYLTTGQAARRLRVSVSTIKRWLEEPGCGAREKRNHNGWRLFALSDVEALKQHKRRVRRNGRRFSETTLVPTVIAAATDGEGRDA